MTITHFSILYPWSAKQHLDSKEASGSDDYKNETVQKKGARKLTAAYLYRVFSFTDKAIKILQVTDLM